MTGAPRDRDPTLQDKCVGDLFERNDSVWPGKFGGSKNSRGQARIFSARTCECFARVRSILPRESMAFSPEFWVMGRIFSVYLGFL